MSDPNARFAIIEIPPGPSPPEAIVVGNMDAVMRCLPQTVASEEQEQRLARAEKQAAETERQQQELVLALRKCWLMVSNIFQAAWTHSRLARKHTPTSCDEMRKKPKLRLSRNI
jgi:hypothetical protein